MNGRHHATPGQIERYVRGDEGLWAVEAHLESCAQCRLQLADTVAGQAPSVTALLDTVWSTIDTSQPAEARKSSWRKWSRRAATWAAPTMTPWLGMTVLITALAWIADLISRPSLDGHPSLLLLLAPVAPVLVVRAAWSRGLDPAHELVAATPRSGLYLVLRRTIAVLALVTPLQLVAGWLTGATSVWWLVPCAAFTLGALGLGTLIGLSMAANVLLGLWTLLVITPSLANDHLAILIEPASTPGWMAAAVLGAVVLIVRADSYAHQH